MARLRWGHLKAYLEGRISFAEAYPHSRILKKIVARILENAQLSDKDAYGVMALYNPYSKDVVEALQRDGLVEIKEFPLGPHTVKLIARPTPKLLRFFESLKNLAIMLTGGGGIFVSQTSQATIKRRFNDENLGYRHSTGLYSPVQR